MNRWKAYGSVSDLVKQFETTKTEDRGDLKKFQSLEDIKKFHDFKTIHSKFENKDHDIVQTNLIKYESTNHLECLQLQEINQARKKLYEITGKLGQNPEMKVYTDYLREVSQLILSVGNVSDYGHAAIKSEKAQLLPLLQRCYLHIRDKLIRENLNFEEDEYVKMSIGENDRGQRSPPMRFKNAILTNGDNNDKVKIEDPKKIVQRKYEKNPSTQHAINPNQESSKKTSTISRRISKLQAASAQEVQLRPKTQDQNQIQNKRHTWDNTIFTSGYTTGNLKETSDKNLIRRGHQPYRSSSFRSSRDQDIFDAKNKWDFMSNNLESGSQRNSWYSSRRMSEIQDNNSQDKYDTESDTASILSGNEMFEQKYSGIADRINNVLKKRISMLEEDGLLN